MIALVPGRKVTSDSDLLLWGEKEMGGLMHASGPIAVLLGRKGLISWSSRTVRSAGEQGVLALSLSDAHSGVPHTVWLKMRGRQTT